MFLLRALPAIIAAFIFAMSCSAVSFEATSTKYSAITRHYKFNVVLKNITRLCHWRSVVTVNGKFPSPRIIAREGDRLVIKVVNHIPDNVTLHWHGIRQIRNGWADGPAYITQCPIQTGQSYVYNFTTVGHRGTFFYHAHISWLRASVYGPLIILPPHHASFPFPKPYKVVPILFGEWFNSDPEAVIKEALWTGNGPNVSDAYTINGLPGFLYNCSAKDTFKLKVKPGKKYLIRLINAALNDELFFGIANHSFTVVEADAAYVKPFQTDILFLGPGQTTNVILETKPNYSNARFIMLARPYFTGLGTFDNSTVAGILEYVRNNRNHSDSPDRLKHRQVFRPVLPPIGGTDFVADFTRRFRSLANQEFPVKVPKTVDRHFIFTIGVGTKQCPENQTCLGPGGAKFSGFVNNISFILPSEALLETHFLGQSLSEKDPDHNQTCSYDFPSFPLDPFNYTGNPPSNTLVKHGTRVVLLPFNTSVELVLQGTSILGYESHPIHLHGYNFYVVGQGFGNFDPDKDTANFNLVDPVLRNTVGVPSGGWAAVRFFADNPGAWFMHCHYEAHMSWGLEMAWIVMEGKLPNQKLLPPPPDLPKC